MYMLAITVPFFSLVILFSHDKGMRQKSKKKKNATDNPLGAIYPGLLHLLHFLFSLALSFARFSEFKEKSNLLQV